MIRLSAALLHFAAAAEVEPDNPDHRLRFHQLRLQSPRLVALHVHPVLLFHLSVVLNPREWYMKEVVPKIRGVPNRWYDYYAPGQAGTKPG